MEPPDRYRTGHEQLTEFFRRQGIAWSLKAEILRLGPRAKTSDLRLQLEETEDGLVDLLILAGEQLPFLELDPLTLEIDAREATSL